MIKGISMIINKQLMRVSKPTKTHPCEEINFIFNDKVSLNKQVINIKHTTTLLHFIAKNIFHFKLAQFSAFAKN